MSSHVIEVAFKGNRREFFLWETDEIPAVNSAIIVEADRGEDLGRVHSTGDAALHRNRGVPHGTGEQGPARKARRVASSDDVRKHDELRVQDEDARRKAMERVRANALVMKVSDAEWQWDRKKLTFYFTAEKRVDFRTLVRELASTFRTRIELKQIGVRDEAKRLDGIGRCGRQYCSASWLPELRPVSLGVAKDQRLSLNPTQISGACGRLMCSLRYEHEFYVQARRRFPKEGKTVRTATGDERVVSNDIFRERVVLRNVEGETRTIPLAQLLQETDAAGGTIIPAAQHRDEDPRLPKGPAHADAVPPVRELQPPFGGRPAESPIDEQVLDEEILREEKEADIPREPVASEEPPAVKQDAPAEKRPHRRRGRRGGRRNRGGGGGRGGRTPRWRRIWRHRRRRRRGRGTGVSKYYLTTAIDYSNGEPHIGHAYEKIGADAIARYRRLRGDDVHFLIGMDEHGHKVAQAAEQRGLTPQQQVDEIAERFQAMWKKLGISHDQFMRTTSDAHKSGVRALIKRIFDNNADDFYERSYSGWYCVGCESFKQDSEIVDGRCTLHPTRTLEWVEERNWFFRLSKYQGFLKRLHSQRPDFLQPESRRNEILALLDQGLEDISASRSRFTWGVPFPAPLSTGETQTTYVWFDALPNYLTATGFPAKGYKERWPAQLHVIGKDITRFHTVIWPAMLQAAELPLPDRVWAHGFVLLAGERFSKSAGVKLDLYEAIDRYGPDAFRYYLLREVPFDTDGSFSWERFEQVYTSELANTWGNLASRAIAMIEKYCDGVVPSAAPNDMDRADAADLVAYHAAMDGARGFLLHEGLRKVMQCVTRGNEYVQASQPWTLAKFPEKRGELDSVLAALARMLARQSVMLYPFVPTKAQELWQQLGAPGQVGDQRFDALDTLDAAGWLVKKGASLFPKSDAPPPAPPAPARK